MKERLLNNPMQSVIDDTDQTINNLMGLRHDYFEELWDTYLHDIENAVELLELLRGILDGSVI